MNLNIKIPVFPSESEGDFHLKYAYPIHFSYPKLIIFIIFSILLLGIPILLLFWLELLHRKFLYVFCEPEKLTHLLLKHEDDTFEISKIEQIFINLQKIHIFKVRQMTYILDKDPKNYTIKLMEYTIDKNCSEIIKMKGLTDLESKFNLKIYGQCLMDVPIPSIPMFFIKEILHPFFIFQFFSVIVWMVESYALFAILILLISIFTAFMNLFTSRKNLIKLKKMAFHFSDVMVYRQENSDFIIIDSRNLVPGDLMVIEKKTILPCDLLLISGDVLINECSLTGESMPIIKTNLPNNQNKYFDISEKNHILYCGTEVLQVKPLIREKFVLGIVYKTGYNTMKGNLLRSILYPKQNIFRFFEESIKFILVISIITVIGFLIVLPRLFEIMNTGQLILKFLDIITVAIPPSLPAAINVGISFALTRLKDKNIFCIQPHKVVIGGRVNMVCFDKTGTITEDTMKFIGVKIVKNNIFIDGDDIENIDLNKNLLYNAMASCHNLISFIDNENKLSLFGDLMEIQMFKYVNAEFHEDFIIRNNFKIKILKKYEFTSETQRMSVLVQEENSQFLYIKGSPEIIKERCLIESLPSNYNEILDEIAQKGFRILAIGYVDFKIEIPESELENISRNAMESKIKFLGFILLDNPIKPEANSTIEELNKANIGVKMLTGDNPLTAINVAREIGIIKKNEEIYLADFDTEKKKLIYKHISLNKEKEIDNNKSVINEEKNNEELIPILESQINYKTFVPNEVKTKILFKNLLKIKRKISFLMNYYQI